jgi:hypothetical protein
LGNRPLLVDVVARRSRRNRSWTATEVELLAKALGEGRSFVEIGAELGRNPDAVRSKAIDTGLWHAGQGRRRSGSPKRTNRFRNVFCD